MLADILKITLPALLVFLASYLALRSLLRNEAERRHAELSAERSKITLPLRLQAYERLTLLLERMQPESIMVRTSRSGMTVAELQTALIGTIRAEWEHNLAQQIYVGREAWDHLRNAKECMVQVVNLCAEKLSPTDPAIALSQSVIDTVLNLDTNPLAVARDFIKREVIDLLN
ncbi:MAG: hypothetical protein IJU72_09455 [Bacteroidales bacterium]|nr:hypothetical protein [Bacteroidales bacterium]